MFRDNLVYILLVRIYLYYNQNRFVIYFSYFSKIFKIYYKIALKNVEDTIKERYQTIFKREAFKLQVCTPEKNLYGTAVTLQTISSGNICCH